MVLTSFLGVFDSRSSTDPSKWSNKKIDKWFEKEEWLNGWQIKPDPSINRKTFTVSYFKNKEKWDKAFTFLKESDLPNLEIKRYDIDGETVFALVSDYLTKNEENALYEVHRKYIDIQYIINGKELIGQAPLSMKKDVLTAYDATKDIEFLTVSRGTNYRAAQGNFYIFFPEDAHRPGLKDGENSQVRKVVVKVKVD